MKRDQYGNPVIGPDGQRALTTVPFNAPGCEQVVDKGLADTLAVTMSKDDVGAGTAAGAAGSVGWTLPMSGKTGTTEAYRSSAFVGFTNQIAGAAYVYSDGPNPQCVHQSASVLLRRQRVRRYGTRADMVPGGETGRDQVRSGPAPSDRPRILERQ